MVNLKSLLPTVIIYVPFLLIGCTINSQKSGTSALFETKVEAEKAAKNFNCTGAHKMGEKWMPCKNHETPY
tara:strand:- start:273 stop:485 length:213 start_codon:yes stop_codon:yes gene_type:complete